jgi:uncharacterized protein YkuJ
MKLKKDVKSSILLQYGFEKNEKVKELEDGITQLTHHDYFLKDEDSKVEVCGIRFYEYNRTFTLKTTNKVTEVLNGKLLEVINRLENDNLIEL